jgi:hypothetical protein
VCRPAISPSLSPFEPASVYFLLMDSKLSCMCHTVLLQAFIVLASSCFQRRQLYKWTLTNEVGVLVASMKSRRNSHLRRKVEILVVTLGPGYSSVFISYCSLHGFRRNKRWKPTNRLFTVTGTWKRDISIPVRNTGLIFIRADIFQLLRRNPTVSTLHLVKYTMH